MKAQTNFRSNSGRPALAAAVAPVLERLEDRRLMSVVTNTNDAGPGSLRDAINFTNATPDNLITFNIPGPGVHTIQPLSALPDVTDAVRIDGTSQPGYAGVPLIELSGASAPGAAGLHIVSGNSVVTGLTINRFNQGIFLDRRGQNVIQRNYIGTDVSGTRPLGNRTGIYAVHSAANLIGGTLRGDFNVISGNFEGVHVTGSTATGNRIFGNYIGTDVSGTSPLGNRLFGVRVRSANSNAIGAPSPELRNIISANPTGVALIGARNLVQGNFIGTDVTGRKPLGNRTGVLIDGSVTLGVSGNFVGGVVGGDLNAGNLISANVTGVLITGRFAQKNFVQGNRVGTDIVGTSALGNRAYGVSIADAASFNLVGGTVPAARNLISGNLEDGVDILRGATRNRVQGNFIGTDVSGNKPLGNGSVGVRILFADNNQIGSAGAGSGARNVISANKTGIALAAAGTIIEGNYIGTDQTGLAPLGNNYGVFVDGNATSGVSGNRVGGAAPGAGNVISANAYGLSVYGQYATGNFVQGNLIGLSAGGTPLGNAVFGVQIAVNASDNAVGGLAPGEGNQIAYNGAEGVVVDSGVSNPILSNSIHDNVKLGIDLNADGPTANDPLDADAGANLSQNFPLIASALTFGGSTSINGTLHSTPGRDFLVQIFANAVPDPSGFGEGQTLLATVPVLTNAAGDASFSVTVPAVPGGTFLSSTATDRITRDTSEFSPVARVREIPIFPFPFPVDPPIVIGPVIDPLPVIDPPIVINPQPIPVPFPEPDPIPLPDPRPGPGPDPLPPIPLATTQPIDSLPLLQPEGGLLL